MMNQTLTWEMVGNHETSIKKWLFRVSRYVPLNGCFVVFLKGDFYYRDGRKLNIDKSHGGKCLEIHIEHWDSNDL